MISIQEATKRARKLLPKADTYREEQKAYIFSNSNAQGTEKVDNAIVILKKNGQPMSYSEYIIKIK